MGRTTIHTSSFRQTSNIKIRSPNILILFADVVFIALPPLPLQKHRIRDSYEIIFALARWSGSLVWDWLARLREESGISGYRSAHTACWAAASPAFPPIVSPGPVSSSQTSHFTLGRSDCRVCYFQDVWSSSPGVVPGGPPRPLPRPRPHPPCQLPFGGQPPLLLPP